MQNSACSICMSKHSASDIRLCKHGIKENNRRSTKETPIGHQRETDRTPADTRWPAHADSFRVTRSHWRTLRSIDKLVRPTTVLQSQPLQIVIARVNAATDPSSIDQVTKPISIDQMVKHTALTTWSNLGRCLQSNHAKRVHGGIFCVSV